MTREEAIAKLVEQDVAKWGEQERGASEAHHRRNSPTVGLALNTLASRASLADPEGQPTAATAALRRAATAAMTPADRRALRQGG